jgi:hypothetical protein
VATTFLGAHALPPEFAGRADDYIAEVCAMLPPLAAEGLVDAVDAFCERIGFSRADRARVRAARAHGLPVKLHAEQLSDQRGAELVARYQGLSADHLEHLSAQRHRRDGRRRHGGGAAARRLLLPARYHAAAGGRLRAAGVPMAVATDCNPGTSPMTSMLLAMNMACTLWRLTPQEALAGCTVHAARALGLQHRSARWKWASAPTSRCGTSRAGRPVVCDRASIPAGAWSTPACCARRRFRGKLQGQCSKIRSLSCAFGYIIPDAFQRNRISMFALNSLRVAVLLALGAQALAQEPTPPVPPAPHADVPVVATTPLQPAAVPVPAAILPTAAPRPFADMVRGAAHLPGFLSLYQKEEKVWIELRPDQFDRPLFMSVNMPNGIGERGVYGSQMGMSRVVVFRRIGGLVQMIARNTGFGAKSGTPPAFRSTLTSLCRVSRRRRR